MIGDERGQGLVEYALILVLIAIVVIAVQSLVGPALNDVFCQIMQSLDEDHVCSSDANLSVAGTMSSGGSPGPGLEETQEKIILLWEEAEAQEESLEEAADLVFEAVAEGLEVLVDFADDNDDQALLESLSQLQQEVKEGNLDAVPEASASLLTELEGAPVEVWTAMSLKAAPRLIDSCELASDGSVPPDMIAEALQAVEQLDEDHPGRAEALQLLQGAVYQGLKAGVWRGRGCFRTGHVFR